jgi:hypothetical protein
MKTFKLLVLMTLFLLLAISLRCDEVNFNYKIDAPENLRVGTPFVLTIELTTLLEDEIHYPVKDTLNTFIILDVRKTAQQDTHHEELKKTTLNYKLAGFDTGEQDLTPIKIEVFRPSNQEIEEFRTSTHFFTIGSVLSDTSMVIKDISPPVRLRLTFWDIALPVLLLILLIAAIILVWKKIVKKSDLPISTVAIDTRSPHLRALELLDQLKSKKLLEKGYYLEFHYSLSFILRYFLEHEYHFHAMEMTTSEIRNMLLLFPDTERDEILEFLRYTDMVKFAKYNPGVERPLKQLKWLEQYLRGKANV